MLADLSGTGDSQCDSRESFAIETPIFTARQTDLHESFEFPIRANHATKWRTEGVDVRKSFLCQMFRHLCCILSPIPPLGEDGHNSGEQFLLHLRTLSVANPLPPTPFRNL